MKKEVLKKYILKYNGYAVNTETHQKPTRGVNSGAHGRLYELLIKLALQNYKFNGVAKQGRKDTRKKINGLFFNIEIKSGCGELVAWDLMTEKIISDIRSNEYVIYAPEFMPVATNDCDRAITNAVKQSYIIETKYFWQELCKNGLIRTKKSSQWYKDTNFSNLPFDRLTISNITQSSKKLNLMYDILEEYGIELETWLKVMGIWE